jgi:ubiquinol-cytochrome c reductase cytochrome b subunit
MKAWLDERTGYRALIEAALDEPVRGGAKPSYVFGSALTFVLLVQIATGIAMASAYSPSVTTAWASVAYLQDQMTGGWIVRGLHSAGASAMIILILLHMLQVTLWGAYKKPREVNWIFGVVMLALVMGFALTGYLLPWDQKGYWATQVATSLLGATPLVGHGLQRLVQGGDAYGNLTLTRFYALHVFVLPVGLVLLTALHVALFRKHGVTPSWSASDAELERKAEPFFPKQLGWDLAAMAVTLAAMALWVWRSHGAELEAPADPSSAYDARPEWYFLPLFQLLKLFPGRAEVPAALGAPLVVFGTLLALPFLDKGHSRSPLHRKRYVGAVVAIIAGAVALGVQAKREDARSEPYQKQRERAQREAERARKLALEGVPPAGGTAVFDNDPAQRARKVLGERCLGCHVYQGAGEERGPRLDGWSSRAWIAGLLADPDADRFYGKTAVHDMKPVKAPPDEIAALTEFVWAQGQPPGAGGVDEGLRARGEALFKQKDCDECHEVDGTSPAGGPNLGGRGGREWTRAFLIDPGQAHFFGKKNKMPKFGEKLSAAEMDAAVDLLLGERASK